MDVFNLDTETDIKNLTVTYGGVKYLKRIPANINAELEMDIPNMRFTFRENTIRLNKLELGINGKFEMPDDDMIFDLSLKAKQNDFKSLLTLLPEEYTKDFDKIKADGSLALNAKLTGVYNQRTMPGFNVNLSVENGSVKYPDLPKSAENINILASVISPGGSNYDNTVVNVSKFHFEVASNPVDATLNLSTPISDPQIDTKIMAQVDLGNLKDVFPLESTNLTGRINADIAVKGKMSDLEAQRYEAFEASGYMELNNFLYKSDSLPKPVTITNAVLKFNPRTLDLTNLVANFGETKLKANGALTNYMAYILKNDTLIGNLYMQASKINLNDFNSSASAGTSNQPASASTGVIKIPANVNFELHSAIDQLIYDKITISDFTGNVIVRDQAVRLENTAMKMLGGSVVINGTYNSKKAEPEFNFDIDVNRLDISKTAAAFNTVALLVPIAKNATGSFAAKFQIKGALDNNMSPVYNTLEGGGLTILSNVFFSNFEPFNKLASELKVDRLAKQKIADSKVMFDIVQGKLIVKPFDTKFGPIGARIAGSTAVNQEIDYVMNFVIPRKEFGEAANSMIDGLVNQANSRGANVSVSEFVDIEVFMTNTVLDPRIRTNLKEKGKSAIDDAKKKLQQELDKKKGEAEEKVKAEVDKAKKEAEDRARQEQERLRQEAEKATNAAKEKVNQETDKAKDEAKKKVKGLFGKPK